MEASDQQEQTYGEAPSGSVPAQNPSTIPPAVGEPREDAEPAAADESGDKKPASKSSKS